MLDVLPDSRLKDRNYGARIDIWDDCPDGIVRRIEMIPAYCFVCGVYYAMVPKGVTWASHLCNECYRTWGIPAGCLAAPDDQFWEDVRQVMIATHGHVLTEEELIRQQAIGWGPLQALVNDSPLLQCSTDA